MQMDCQDPPLFPDDTHFEDMFDDDFDLDAKEPESPCGVTAFDVERAARSKASTVRRAPKLPGLNVDAIDLDAMISPRAHDSPVDGFLFDGGGGLAFEPVATPLGTPKMFLSPQTTPKGQGTFFRAQTPATPPPLGRWAEGLGDLSDAARAVARALLRAERAVGGEIGGEALACVAAVAKLAPGAAEGAVRLAEAVTCRDADTLAEFAACAARVLSLPFARVASLARLGIASRRGVESQASRRWRGGDRVEVGTASTPEDSLPHRTLAREADTARQNDAARRRAWRPLAAYRAAHKGFEPTFAEEAALALKLWADLAKDTFDAATLQSMEAKTVACDLALLLDRLFGGDDAARDVAAVQALGRAAGVVIRRAALWGADDVRKVLNLVAAVGANPRASVDLLTHFAVALELATRRKKRPARFKKHAFSSYTDGSPVDAYEEGVPENAQSLLKKVLQTASQRGVVALAGVDLLRHDHAYAARARSRALSRLVAAALAPAKGAWGARWRLDSNFAAALPQEMNLGDPRAFALALVEHNDLEALCGSVEALVDDAERFGGLKAAWLAPYQVHVSKTVTMLCVDFAARDPAHDCTAIATTVQFVAREA